MSVCSAMASKGGAHIIELALLYMLYNEAAALAVNQEKLAVKLMTGLMDGSLL